MSAQHSGDYQHLRERIARALDADHLTRDGLGREEVAEHLRMADLVLDALGLERVECRFCGFADDGPCEDGMEHAYLWLIGADFGSSPHQETDQ